MTNTLPNQTPRAARGSHLHPPKSRPLIVIIGHDDDTREMFRAILEHWGYEVLEAETADRAISLAIGRQPALILIESTLHFNDVLDDVMKLRHNDCCKDTPSLMLSGYSQEFYRKAAISSGASGFLVKPVDFDVLYDHIQMLVSERHAH